MAKYFRVGKSLEHKQVDTLFTESERGLDGVCIETGNQHRWLIFPDWSQIVKDGGKEYVLCLDCGENSHL